MTKEEQLKKEIVDMANELMSDWPSSRNQQRDFVLEYVGNGFTNASEAARNAGYSEKSAANTANKMLTGSDKFRHIPPVVNRLKKAYQDRQTELKIADGTEILQRLTQFGRQELMEKYYKSEKTIDGKRTVEENRYTTTPSDEDALKALELLMKSFGLDNPNNDLVRRKLELENEKLESQLGSGEEQDNKIAGYISKLKDVVTNGNDD